MNRSRTNTPGACVSQLRGLSGARSVASFQYQQLRNAENDVVSARLLASGVRRCGPLAVTMPDRRAVPAVRQPAHTRQDERYRQRFVRESGVL